jgi:hypothetical protein
MRVRCSFCGAEYDAAVTPAALGIVDRCGRCGRTGLRPAEEDEPPVPLHSRAPRPAERLPPERRPGASAR